MPILLTLEQQVVNGGTTNNLTQGGNGVVCLNLGAFQNLTLLQNS
jgi:hypothetical protein